ncbi:MAG: hypothetical protein JWQ23_2843 [Herminiimonas sp.]|nr:hypothetical protein [Herminiimonas sp.]
MQVISLENLTLNERKLHAREGRFRSYMFAEGTEGAPGNFSLKLSHLSSDFKSPRHRHNFDQIRYLIDGHYDYGEDGELSRGCIGYFPEGTAYGPQTITGDSRHVILQFGGASGSGFISESQYARAMEELGAEGSFEGGFLVKWEDGVKIRKDAYEAIWERLNERPLQYPPQRYGRPIFMNPENFDWTPDASQAGVENKWLGSFTEAHTEISFHRIASGKKMRLPGRSLYFVVAGSAHAEDKIAREHTVLAMEEPAEGEIEAIDTLVLLRFGLPNIG